MTPDPPVAGRALRFRPAPWSNDPPYLFHIANHCTDPPAALAFLEDLREECIAYEADQWAEARAMGVV
jgi:hypothetical protein